jgi:hypothetical protein
MLLSRGSSRLILSQQEKYPLPYAGQHGPRAKTGAKSDHAA